jgi:citrate lyase subunit alpha/citrate CoA-transferase
MLNANHQPIPEYVEGIGKAETFDSTRCSCSKHNNPTLKERQKKHNKIVESLEKAIDLTGLKDSMTISFHHHFRNGDFVVNMVLEAIAKMGIKDLTLAASSLTDIHAPLIKHIESGVIRRIETSGLRGELAQRVSSGLMDIPVIFRSHGGRGRVIANGQVKIDVAFLGVPSSDSYGNANGYSRDGDNSSACGSMGYAKLDAQYADKVVLITDHLVPFPNTPFGIPQSQVDYIVVVDAIGDPKGIISGATRFTTNPRELLIAKTTVDVIEASGYFEDGFSFQTGTGGSALAVTRFMRDKMLAKNIKASFALGGITGQIVKLHEEGLIKKLLDVQSFDLIAVESLKNNRFHQQIDASYYANPDNEGSAVNQLDVVVLSALEIDTNFNVNVLTGSDGVIRGAIGGHPDTAAGACMTIIVAPLLRGRMPTILDRVNTIVTPGNTIDVLVTDQGIAVNPLREDLYHSLKAAKLQVCSIEELKEKTYRIVGVPKPIEYLDKVVGAVTYRDGRVIDVIRQVKNFV